MKHIKLYEGYLSDLNSHLDAVNKIATNYYNIVNDIVAELIEETELKIPTLDQWLHSRDYLIDKELRITLGEFHDANDISQTIVYYDEHLKNMLKDVIRRCRGEKISILIMRDYNNVVDISELDNYLDSSFGLYIELTPID